MAQNHPHDFTKRHNIKTRFPEPFVREIEERFGDCLDTDYGAGRGNGMSGIVAGKQPNEAERVDRGERAPRCGLDCRPNMRAEPHGSSRPRLSSPAMSAARPAYSRNFTSPVPKAAPPESKWKISPHPPVPKP